MVKFANNALVLLDAIHIKAQWIKFDVNANFCK